MKYAILVLLTLALATPALATPARAAAWPVLRAEMTAAGLTVAWDGPGNLYRQAPGLPLVARTSPAVVDARPGDVLLLIDGETTYDALAVYGAYAPIVGGPITDAPGGGACGVSFWCEALGTGAPVGCVAGACP